MANTTQKSRQTPRWVNPALWILVAVYVASLFEKPYLSPSANSALFHAIVFVFALVHGARRYGVNGIAVLLLLSELVGNFMENLSIHTGFPFGHYYYTQNGIPFLLQVPITIGLAYFAVGYMAWTVANILLDKADEKMKTPFSLIALPVVASFLMVMWDVVIDPTSSTIEHTWIWLNGGPYFGVPFTNYLGWFLTVFIFFQLFALFLKKAPAPVKESSLHYWLQAVIFYFLVGFAYVIALFNAKPGRIVDAAGHVWQKHDIQTTAALICLYTMTFVSVLAVFRLINSPRKTPKKV